MFVFLIRTVEISRDLWYLPVFLKLPAIAGNHSGVQKLTIQAGHFPFSTLEFFFIIFQGLKQSLPIIIKSWDSVDLKNFVFGVLFRIIRTHAAWKYNKSTVPPGQFQLRMTGSLCRASYKNIVSYTHKLVHLGVPFNSHNGLHLKIYCKHRRISRTFLPKMFVQNQGCGLSAGTSAMDYCTFQW